MHPKFSLDIYYVWNRIKAPCFKFVVLDYINKSAFWILLGYFECTCSQHLDAHYIKMLTHISPWSLSKKSLFLCFNTVCLRIFFFFYKWAAIWYLLYTLILLSSEDQHHRWYKVKKKNMCTWQHSNLSLWASVGDFIRFYGVWYSLVLSPTQ